MSRVTFSQFLLTAFSEGPLTTDDAIAFLLPLMEEIAAFHDRNKVAVFENPGNLFITDGRLDIDDLAFKDPVINLRELQSVLKEDRVQGFAITERWKVDEQLTGEINDVQSELVSETIPENITRPVYLPGVTCYEMRLGHHDASTDIFCLGLILGSVIMGLDLDSPDDLNTFAENRRNPAALNARLHPAVGALVTEMSELDRDKRSRDLHEIIRCLKNYRDFDPQRQQDLSSAYPDGSRQPISRKKYILEKLKTRLFDNTKRNRLLYYKPNARFVNLTVSSVPMVLHFQSINPELLFTWNNEVSDRIKGQKDIPLNKFLRFEDHLYLNSQLNTIRLQSEADKREYGFKQLKLVIAFLNWHNLKDEPDVRIQSPLLLLPVGLERKKSLRDERFTLKIEDNVALVNPVLANYLAELYGILLPETVDFDVTSMNDFYNLLAQKIEGAKQGVQLQYIREPRLKLVHTIAKQTINNYKKRLRPRHGHNLRINYSYSKEDFRPLSLEIFRSRIEPDQSGLELLITGRVPGNKGRNFSVTTSTVSSTKYQVVEGDSNPYAWEFDVCNIVLGNFNYKKMTLVSDYNQLIATTGDHKVFDTLFNNEARLPREKIPSSKPADWYHVVAADPTQTNAVLANRIGKSYVIQGPPGTGKSQTITNLIADFVARDKTVLFVCEKRAALDVVYHRLEQNNLAELCCYIHDSQSDKKEFYQDLKEVYESFVQSEMNYDLIIEKRTNTLRRMELELDALQKFHCVQAEVYPEVGKRTHELIGRLLSLRSGNDSNDTPFEGAPFYRNWSEFGTIIEQLSAALKESGDPETFAVHPFRNIGNKVIVSDNPVAVINEIVGHARELLEKINQVLTDRNVPGEHTASLRAVKNLIEDSAILEPLASTSNLFLVDKSTQHARKFEAKYNAYKAQLEASRESSEKNKRWISKLPEEDVTEAISLATKHEHSWFSILNGRWRRLKKLLNQSYDFSAHSVRPSYSSVLRQLSEEYMNCKVATAAKKEIESDYGLDNLERTVLGIELLRRKQGDKEIDYLLHNPDADKLVLQLSNLNGALQQVETQLASCMFNYENYSLQQLSAELAAFKAQLPSLRGLLPVLRKFSELPEDVQQFIRYTPVGAAKAEHCMAERTMNEILNQQPSFRTMNFAAIRQIVGLLENLYNELLLINSEYIRAGCRKRFKEHYAISNLSATVLTPEQKTFKKQYTDGRKVVEREMNKTMRFKSIREIVSNESGVVLKEIKPVWLMSPLSVSDSLPLDPDFFDVVIYDEASQIALEEGIPALFRAAQAIVVGDEKQMPPSNFFSAKLEDPEDFELIDGEDEEDLLSSDVDSLLVQASRKLDSVMLSWHYRSRYETLISYSNHAFYGGRLLTVPDRTIHHKQRSLLTVADAADAEKNAAFLYSASMSFHYMPGSTYDNRSNAGEAKYIAAMVCKLLKDGVQESIGIVAFSQEQQGEIEDAMTRLCENDKQFEELLERAYSRKDDGQFTGLFIKNLENVQGDERDIIIMSVCYGYDTGRKMLMNFGPINRKGGEKRLNVIFSRARKHMAVISSIRHFDITNDHNDGARYFKQFLQYAELVSTGNMSNAEALLNGFTGFEKPSKLNKNSGVGVIVADLQEVLRNAGFVSDANVGQSDFQCHLAVKKNADAEFYELGILIDDERHYSNLNVMEQYVNRPALLRSFGWKVFSIFSKDWLDQRELVIQQLFKVLG